MSKISEMNLGSAFLSFFVLLGFIATAIAVIRLTIIGVNFIRANYSKDEGEVKKIEINKTQSKGF